MNHPFITFNTGRMYSEKGQRIAAAIKDGRCHFVDVDRSINGSFECALGTALTSELVMANYDHCNYTGMCDFVLRSELQRLALEFKEK